ncbi:MAG TPA: 2-hydroxyacid dehydrogenase [Acidobacteriaceae bacterium]|nr:2-hydroxyacid dehydrogenase [Acidobacteriaceae bacterium]
MLKVGIPEAVSPELHRLFPEGIALEVVPFQPDRPFEIEFWIAPPWTNQAHQIWPWLRGVRVVQATVAGVDGILPLIPRDVLLCDARGAHTIPTAEWTVAAVLGALKYFPLYADVQRAGLWSRRKEGEARYQALHPSQEKLYPTVLCEELHGRQVLIVGYGDIGRAIEARLLPFGVEIVRVARTAREGVHGVEKLMDLLPTADAVILIVPFTSETTGMIGAPQIARMKQGALLVNAARGPVVSTDALVAALHGRHIQAAIDVTDPEPLPDAHPLWSAPNLLITPHIAGSTPMFMRRAMEFAAAQVRRYLRGEPLENRVIGEY